MERYLGDQIYTYIGDILIAVNPFKVLSIYDKQVLTRLYRKYRKIDLKAVFQLRVFHTPVHARKTLNPFQYYI